MSTPDLRAYAAPWRQAVEFLFRQGDAHATNLTMVRTQEGQVIEPTFRLSYEAAQTLMDDLWNAGLRPTEGTGSAGALAATQRHLEDMRKLVFESK